MCEVTGEFGGAWEIGTAQWEAKDRRSALVAIGGSFVQAARDTLKGSAKSELMVASRLPPESFLVIKNREQVTFQNIQLRT